MQLNKTAKYESGEFVEKLAIPLLVPRLNYICNAGLVHDALADGLGDSRFFALRVHRDTFGSRCSLCPLKPLSLSFG